MFELVPSKYLREVFKKNDFELTEFNKATIIWNRNDVRREERISALKEIAEKTTDQELKLQIQERLDYEDCMLERHKHNRNQKYVYVVLDTDEYGCGYFSDYDMAYFIGRNKQMLNNPDEEHLNPMRSKMRVSLAEAKNLSYN